MFFSSLRYISSAEFAVEPIVYGASTYRHSAKSFRYDLMCLLMTCIVWKVLIASMLSGVDDEAGDFTGLAMNAYWSQEQILRADFREMATGISDVCVFKLQKPCHLPFTILTKEKKL